MILTSTYKSNLLNVNAKNIVARFTSLLVSHRSANAAVPKPSRSWKDLENLLQWLQIKISWTCSMDLNSEIYTSRGKVVGCGDYLTRKVLACGL